MPIYKIQMRWLHSVETLVLDTCALPQLESFETTSDCRAGETNAHRYKAKVMKFSEQENTLSLVLRYDQSDNPDIPNDSWGTSTITVRLGTNGPTGTAVWKDDKVERYNGSATVRITESTTLATDMADELQEDFAEIVGIAPVTGKLTQILARIGQGKFRAEVTRAWNMGERCAVTGIDVPEMLIASHILPWRESDNWQRTDAANGLLLAAHVDKLFDRHLLSFRKTDAGYLLELNLRAIEAAKKTGIEPGMKLPLESLSQPLRERFKEYMGVHYERFKEKKDDDSPDLW